VPGYLVEYRKGKEILDAAISGCSWLRPRVVIDGGLAAPYAWSCMFYGEDKGITSAVFRAALREAGCHASIGFVQRPAYKYNFFINPNAYGNKGCPYNCPHYDGTIDWPDGLCPVAEDVLPRLVSINNMATVANVTDSANKLKNAIALAESGTVKPLDYSDTEKKMLELIKDRGPLEPYEVLTIFDENGWVHMDEHTAFSIMEGLRDRLPYKLSHAGPRKFAYHEFVD